MKKILITGANSYIGTSFESYIKENFANNILSIQWICSTAAGKKKVLRDMIRYFML